MAIDAVEIVSCPAELRAEALALVLRELAPSLRRDVAGDLLHIEGIEKYGIESLYIARRGTKLCGAAWGQRQSGDIAVFWPPQLEAGEERITYRLAEAVVTAPRRDCGRNDANFPVFPASGSRKSFAARRVSSSGRFALSDF